MVSNQEAIDMVVDILESTEHNVLDDQSSTLQEAAEALTLEAYVRGSLDNIGVLVIALAHE